MGLLLSRLRFLSLRLIANHQRYPIVFHKLVSEFQSHSRHRLSDLKMIYQEGEINANIGRQLIFIHFLQELKLTEEEWEEVYRFFL